MRSMIIISFITSIFLLNIIVHLFAPSNLSKSELVDKLLKETGNNLKSEKNLQLIGTGSRMMNEIKMLGLSFRMNKPVTIQEARNLLIYSVDTLVSKINHDEKLRPYLIKQPFTAENVQIRIFIDNGSDSYLNSEPLYLISALEGELNYQTRGPNGRLKEVLEESYSDAKMLSSEQSIDYRESS
jgi:hypothetical protein